ncbi:MAG: hypothetical protein MUF43_05995 [Flavobacterium sp.]|jgi:hypothetical protein|nr:hypothetical protein [Flavobacterium sp.]
MFFKIIKEFFLKKRVNKRLTEYQLSESDGTIETVGILIDETHFEHKQLLIESFISNGFLAKNITVVSFKNRYKSKDVVEEPYFSLKNVGISGAIKKKEIQDFIDQPFDMLVSYYDEKKAPLMLVTKRSKAKFKVGFSSVDKRIFHFMIGSETDNYKEFNEELFKYLKILNKI